MAFREPVSWPAGCITLPEPARAGMIELLLVGIGPGHPEQITLQAIRALNRADLVLIPRKGDDKADLAETRRAILREVLTNPQTRIAEFDLPARDETIPDYETRVERWHDAIGARWRHEIALNLGTHGVVALLVWGDPALYDSTLRIAARLGEVARIAVVPGVTALAALTAAHAIPLNEIGAPFLVTTGRRLRDEGWPPGIDTLVLMLDGGGAFETLDPEGVTIFWGACLGTPEEITLAGPLGEMAPLILARRAEARARLGWVMDVYILKRSSGCARGKPGGP